MSKFQIIVRSENGNEKIISWGDLVPHSSINNFETDYHPYNKQLKQAAEKGFECIVKEDRLDFTELEKVVVENKRQLLFDLENSDRARPLIFEKFQEVQIAFEDARRNYHEVDFQNRKLCDENTQLCVENKRLLAMIAQTQNMVKNIGAEEVPHDAQVAIEMNLQPPPVHVVVPKLQKKSRTKLFCALFVTGGMLTAWGLKYFFNK